MGDRIYCTLAELIADLELGGLNVPDEAKVLRNIRAASDWIDRRAGWFVPVTATRRYDGRGGKTLFIDPLLAVTTLTDDAATLTTGDYLLYPRNRHWENGPYTRIEIDPDATALTAWTNEPDIVAITGRWGKYEASLTTGTTVNNTTQISSSGTLLIVTNGGAISPGMVLLIETEQLTVEATAVSLTTAASTTGEALDATETEIDVTTGSEFNGGEVIQIDAEEFYVKHITGNTLYVVRGWNGTTRATHSTGATIKVYRTYTVKRGVNGTTAAAHPNGTAISRYAAPYDVNWLTREIAGLMWRKAQAGFAAKSGSDELGAVFYYDEFPKRQVQEVVNNYRLVSI